jgi:hypothetical protein
VALDWQPVSIPFVGGIDTKAADSAIEAPKLARAENVVFTQRGQVKKRHGSDRLARSISDATSLTAGKALFTRGDELLMADGERLFSYSEARGTWEPRGNLTPLAIATSTINETASNQHSSDYAESNGIGVCAWEDSRGGVRYCVVDTATGAMLYADQSLATDGYAPRVVAIDGFIHVLYVDDSEAKLKDLVIQPENLANSLAAAATDLADDIRDTSNICYDVVVYGSYGIFAYATTVAAETKVKSLSRTGSAAHSTTLSVTTTSVAVGVTNSDQYPRLLLVCGTATGVSVAYASPVPDATQFVFSAFESKAIADVVRVTVASCSVEVATDDDGDEEADESTFQIWVERSAAATSNHLVEIYGFSGYSTFTGALAYTIRHAALASGAFRSGRYGYAVLCYVNTIQPTYFLYRHDAVMVGRFLAANAGGLPQSSRGATVLGRPQVSEDGPFIWAGVERQSLETEPTTNANGVITALNVVRADYRLALISFDFDAAIHGVEVGESLYLTGGMLWQYDGVQVTEAGFSLYPETFTLAVSNGTGSLDVSSTYAYRWYYAWTNAQGETEFSGALPAIATTGASDDTVTVTLPTLTHTNKTGVRLVGYRTEGTPVFDSSFYQVTGNDPATATGSNCYVPNDKTANTISFQDDLADTSLIAKAVDYQSGGELQNIAPPAPSVIAQGDDRIFSVDAGSSDTVRPSKLHFDGSGVHFTDEFDPISIDRAGGPITAVAVLNDNLVVFKRDRVFVVTGDGPSNTGIGSFSPAKEVTGDVGCIDQRSVVRTPQGLMFQSEKGIQLLDHGFQVGYIGADVEAYNSQTVTSATLVNDSNQVRFLTDEGSTLLFDYYFGQWATWTNYEGVSACLWQGETYCYLKSNGYCHVENEGHTDAGAAISMLVETGWLKFAGGLQGYQSLRRFGVLGEYRSAHTMRVTVSKDYKVETDYSFTWDPSTVMNLSTWGGEATWGASSWGGTGSSVYQFLHRPRDQKGQSYKFRFEDIPDAPAGESYVLTELMLEIGIKGGVFRSAALKTANSGG